MYFAVLAAAARAGISAMTPQEANRLTPAHVAAREFTTAIAQIFVEFYARAFEGPANILENLRATEARELQTHFAGLETPVETEDQLVLRAKATSAANFNSILRGDFRAFREVLEDDLMSLSRATLRKNLRADKSFFYKLLNRVITELLGPINAQLAGINQPPVTHGLTGPQWQSAFESLVGRLRRTNIRLHLSRALLIASVCGDRHNHITAELKTFFINEVDVKILGEVRDDLKRESTDFVAGEVIPMFLKMFAKKLTTDNADLWRFINLRTNTLIGHSLTPAHQRLYFRTQLAGSLADPAVSLDSTPFGDRFRRYVVSRFEAKALAISKEEAEFFYQDYLACKPAAIDAADLTLLRYDVTARYAGNINNYLWFIRLFKYFSDAPAEGQKRLADLGALFDHLYSTLLRLRVASEQHNGHWLQWVAYVRDDLVSGMGKSPVAKFIPVTFVLTAMLYDPALPYDCAVLDPLDPKAYYFHQLAADDAFLLDYKGATPKGCPPHSRMGTSRSVLLPEVGVLTEREHAALSDPAALSVLRKSLANGKRLVKMSDISAEFAADEEVLVYLVERESSACAGAGKSELF